MADNANPTGLPPHPNNAQIAAEARRLAARLTEAQTAIDALKENGVTKEDVRELEQTLQQLNERLGQVDPNSELVFTKAMNQAILNEIEAQLTPFAQQFQALETKVDANHRWATENVGRIDGNVGRLTHRVFNLEQVRDMIPWGRVAFAAIVGIIVGFVWNSIEFTQTYLKDDGEPVAVPLEAVNSIWVAILAGVVAFGLTLGLLLIFFVKTRQTQYAADEAPNTPTPQPTPVAHTAPPAHAEDTAPIRVPETQGAGSGTR